MKQTILYKIIFLFLLHTVFVWNAGAQQQYPDSLNVYFGIAAKNNPTVQQKFLEYKASLEKIQPAGSLPDPQMEFGFYLKPMELVSGNQVADVKLMQMFPWMGTLSTAKEEMKYMAQADYSAFLNARNEVYYNVESSWLEIYRVNRKIKIAAKNIQLLKTIERIALIKYKTSGITDIGSSVSGEGMNGNSGSGSSSSGSGMNTMGGSNSNTSQNNSSVNYSQSSSMSSGSSGSGLTDLYKIRTVLLDLQNDSLQYENQKSVLTAKFNLILDRPTGTAVYVPDSLALPQAELTVLNLTDSVFTTNPMLTMLQNESKSLESRKLMADKMRYPMLGLGINYSFISKSSMSTSDMNGKDMIMPMVSMTLPIYQKKYKSAINEAELLNEAKQQEYKAEENELKSEYLSAYQDYLDAQRNIKLYKSQKELSLKTLTLLLSSYSTSGTELTDILIVQQELLDYELKLEEASVDYCTAISSINKLQSYTNIKTGEQ